LKYSAGRAEGFWEADPGMIRVRRLTIAAPAPNK
jgi:hypothetical protein